MGRVVTGSGSCRRTLLLCCMLAGFPCCKCAILAVQCACATGTPRSGCILCTRTCAEQEGWDRKENEADRNGQAAENVKRQTSEREQERLPQGWRGRRWPGPRFRRSQCTCCRRHRKHTHPAHATPQCKCMATHFANEHATTQLCIHTCSIHFIIRHRLRGRSCS